MVEIIDEHYEFDRSDRDRIVAALAAVSRAPETFVAFGEIV